MPELPELTMFQERVEAGCEGREVRHVEAEGRGWIRLHFGMTGFPAP